MNDIIHRVKSVFSNTAYKNRVDNSDKRWLDDDIDVVFEGIMKSLNLIGNFFR